MLFKIKNLFSIYALILAFPVALFSQKDNNKDWVNLKNNPSVNYYEVKKAFDEYWKNWPKDKKKYGYKQFMRWANFVKPRVAPSGDRDLLNKGFDNYFKYKKRLQKRSIKGDWTYMGNNNVPDTVNGPGGMGRLNRVIFNPNTEDEIFVASASGGLWKSTNKGAAWENKTDQLPSLGVTDVAVDYTNTDIIYMATGDGDGMDAWSVGVWKSTDGGNTWNRTGLDWKVVKQNTINRLLIHPNNPDILLAATSNGIYKTNDAATNWTKTQSGQFMDMEFRPTDPATVYAVGSGSFYRSRNTADSFTKLNSDSLPDPSNVRRYSLDVTPAAPDYVYLLGANSR
ncbi:MAG: WD40/YVTN/BNR-like repeat-containing protein, partial [Flavobacteriales bacterium]